MFTTKSFTESVHRVKDTSEVKWQNTFPWYIPSALAIKIKLLSIFDKTNHILHFKTLLKEPMVKLTVEDNNIKVAEKLNHCYLFLNIATG